MENDYFLSYSNLSIHEIMIKDKVRTESYRNAILRNKHLFENKIVLDVGCGTGILSLFAVEAGAKQVFAVDASRTIRHARKIVEANGKQDKIILIEGKVEDIELPVEQVDIIISEWMGYCLLYESMLDTVIFARRKWLKPNGLLFPDKVNLYMSAFENEKRAHRKFTFWENVYGYDFSCIKDYLYTNPVIDFIDQENKVSENFTVKKIDLYSVETVDLCFEVPFQLTSLKDTTISGFVFFFDYGFTAGEKPLWITTGPEGNDTHWKQTLCCFENPPKVLQGDSLNGVIRLRKNNKCSRQLNIFINFVYPGINGNTTYEKTFNMYLPLENEEGI